jgi:hypothetical protein
MPIAEKILESIAFSRFAIFRLHSLVTISLDFKRAFESIKISLFLDIMELYGIRETELEWFTDYFSNRKQKVKIGKKIFGLNQP